MSNWSIAVFAKDEEATIESCLRAIEQAEGGIASQTTLIVNGCTDSTIERALDYRQRSALQLEVFSCPAASKANAWNRFIHDLRPDADLYFFVDGYVLVEPDALVRLAEALASNPLSHAATSRTLDGPGSEQQSRGDLLPRRLLGGLHVLGRPFVDAIVERGYRQPFGLYRGDGLIGSMLMHDLDPRRHAWRRDRVAVVEGKTWSHRLLSPFRYKDVKRHFRRRIYHARGRLENPAIREIIQAHGYEGLPAHADAMIADWLSRQDEDTLRRLRRDPFMRLALRQLKPESPPATSTMMLEPCAA